MILRKIVREKVVDYFRSPGWSEVMGALSRGHQDVLHAHVYLDSILDPNSVLAAAASYFEGRGLQLGRKVPILSHGHGRTIIYYLQPGEMCHFEIFLRFNEDVVLEPMPIASARSGKAFEFWDRAYMDAYYQKFPFKPVEPSDRHQIEQFFEGAAWNELYHVMGYADTHGHAHCIVDTKHHPEELMKLGLEAIRRKGWDVDRSVSVVFGFAGLDQGKISFLLSKPQIVLELEWNYNPDVVIKPRDKPVARYITYETVRRDMDGIPYLSLNEDDKLWIAAQFASDGSVSRQ